MREVSFYGINTRRSFFPALTKCQFLFFGEGGWGFGADDFAFVGVAEEVLFFFGVEGLEVEDRGCCGRDQRDAGDKRDIRTDKAMGAVEWHMRKMDCPAFNEVSHSVMCVI